MASYASIYMNYQQAVRQANELLEQAEKLRNVANRDVGDTMSRLSHGWEGQSATTFLKKCSQLKNELLRAAARLENTAAAIKRAAKNVRDADLRAKQLAERTSAFGGGGGGG